MSLAQATKKLPCSRFGNADQQPSILDAGANLAHMADRQRRSNYLLCMECNNEKSMRNMTLYGPRK